jgi:hypothetical protein
MVESTMLLNPVVLALWCVVLGSVLHLSVAVLEKSNEDLHRRIAKFTVWVVMLASVLDLVAAIIELSARYPGA